MSKIEYWKIDYQTLTMDTVIYFDVNSKRRNWRILIIVNYDERIYRLIVSSNRKARKFKSQISFSSWLKIEDVLPNSRPHPPEVNEVISNYFNRVQRLLCGNTNIDQYRTDFVECREFSLSKESSEVNYSLNLKRLEIIVFRILNSTMNYDLIKTIFSYICLTEPATEKSIPMKSAEDRDKSYCCIS